MKGRSSKIIFQNNEVGKVFLLLISDMDSFLFGRDTIILQNQLGKGGEEDSCSELNTQKL